MTEPLLSNTTRGPIYRFLAEDHARLDDLLERATADPTQIEMRHYDAFRRGLLKHIGMEEKILLPAARQARGGEPLEIAAKLRLDHGAIAALMVPTPTRVIIRVLRTILAAHNEIEEGPNGLYATCEQILGAEAPSVLARLEAAPDVPVNAHVDSPRVMDATYRALARAGFEDLLQEWKENDEFHR
jgi:hypothetical protein